MANHAAQCLYTKLQLINNILPSSELKLSLTYLLTTIFFTVSILVNGQTNEGKALRGNRRNLIVKTRIGISPVIGIYSPNKNIASGTRQKMAFCFSIKEEITLSKRHRDFLWIGAEYMFHGVNFKSYYFYADSLQLYTPDRKRFTYDITMHEIDFPIQLKHSFTNETNSLSSLYIYGGYCYRWLLASRLTVSENGNEMINQSEKLVFKNPAFNSSNSSFLNLGIGFQKNNVKKKRAVFAELQFKYALSPLQFSESFTPSSMYFNGHFIYITIGFKI